MKTSLTLAVFGSSPVFAGKDAGPYFRGIARACAERGHRTTFYEPDVPDRLRSQDVAPPAWSRVVTYSAESPAWVLAAVEQARGADLVIKLSGVDGHDAFLDQAVLDLRAPHTRVGYWDVDPAATVQRMANHPGDPFARLVSHFDFILTCGGGSAVTKGYHHWGALGCVPIFPALDPHLHFPVPPEPRFTSSLGCSADRVSDRAGPLEEMFLRSAALLPQKRFLLGGHGWADQSLPGNVNHVGHVYAREQNAFNGTPMALLQLPLESSASNQLAPSPRVFEAAGAGACLIIPGGTGVDAFLEPDREVLLAEDAEAVARHLRSLTLARAREIGEAALCRIRSSHTYHHRVAQIESLLDWPLRPIGMPAGAGARH